MLMIDQLHEAIVRAQNPTALGLDTQFVHVPEALKAGRTATEAVFAYNVALLDALMDLVPAVKVQIAYYEQLGPEGMSVFAGTLREAKARGYIVIADAKRNDIGPTAKAYANAFLGAADGESDCAFEADFLTINPYLGVDGVQPFLDACAAHDKGLFILAKTSNPSSGQLQDMVFQDGRTLYEAVGDLISGWGEGFLGECGYASVGAVVGATHPEQGARLRQRLRSVFFLVPGYGAQGAKAEDLAVMFGEKGRGAIVNASRSLLTAHQNPAYSRYSPTEAVIAEAKNMRSALLKAIGGQIV